MGTARNVLAVLTLLVPVAVCQLEMPTAMKEPALPFVDRGACPFEGCAYRAWKALTATDVFDNWEKGRKIVAHLAPGDPVTGLTGLVITIRPGVARMDRDLPAHNLKRGDRILAYTYLGEGNSAVWFNDRFYPEFDFASIAAPPGIPCPPPQCAATLLDKGEKVWWAQVKLKSGLTGWVNMETAQFSGVDRLG
jgi:hypothetical protein